MLAALIVMYRITDCVLGTTVLTVQIGVRQGLPTSYLLFILYVNHLIKLIKENCRSKGFLRWLHLLVLMDDTVLVATTKVNMLTKLKLLKEFYENYGMQINQSKTVFLF